MTAREHVRAKRRAQIGAARIAYVDVGDGPVVVLLHGCSFSSFVWRMVIAHLRGRFRCVAPDLLGAAVVATGTATRQLHYGQLVTVDGSAGTVTPIHTGQQQ